MNPHRSTSAPRRNSSMWRVPPPAVLLSALSALPVVAALGGCTDSAGAMGGESTDSVREEILGGVPAASDALDAVGSLAFEMPIDAWSDGGVPLSAGGFGTLIPPVGSGAAVLGLELDSESDSDPGVGAGAGAPRYKMFCTASLIGGATVMTAGHCVAVAERIFDSGGVVYFGIGADAQHPKRKIEVVDFATSSIKKGGWRDSGSDVGVLHLAEPISDIPPLRLGRLTDGDVDSRFAVIGFGYASLRGPSGVRKAGSGTLRARTGRVFDIYYGSFEAFKAWADSHRPAGVPDAAWGTLVRNEYEKSALLPEYQAVVGGLPGDAQPCFGDSGAPLVRRADHALYAYGVASRTWPSSRSACAYGAVFATFGPATYGMLDREKDWVDPCTNVPRTGQCEGAVATRCTYWDEGPREVTRTDCDAIGQACGFDARGAVACVERH